MTKKKHIERISIAVISLLLCLVIVFGFMTFSKNKDVVSLRMQNTDFQTSLTTLQNELASRPNITQTEIDELREKEEVIANIQEYQKVAVKHMAQAEEIGANLIDYYNSWANSVIGSPSEKRALERYKEELDKLQNLKEENNKLISDNSNLIQEYLYINPDDSITANNLVFTSYQDQYFEMLNYEE